MLLTIGQHLQTDSLSGQLALQLLWGRKGVHRCLHAESLRLRKRPSWQHAKSHHKKSLLRKRVGQTPKRRIRKRHVRKNRLFLRLKSLIRGHSLFQLRNPIKPSGLLQQPTATREHKMRLSDDLIAHKPLLRVRPHPHRQRRQDANDMVEHAGLAEQAQC